MARFPGSSRSQEHGEKQEQASGRHQNHADAGIASVNEHSSEKEAEREENQRTEETPRRKSSA